MNRRSLWDEAGITVSALCMMHCLALPALLGLLPGLAAAAGHTDQFHLAFAVLLVGVVAAAFVPGYRRHGRRAVLALGLAGLALVLTGAVTHELLGGPGETMLTVAGSLTLVGAHWGNRRACPRCSGARPAVEA